MMHFLDFVFLFGCSAVFISNGFSLLQDKFFVWDKQAQAISNPTLSDWCQLLIVFAQLASILAYVVAYVVLCLMVLWVL